MLNFRYSESTRSSAASQDSTGDNRRRNVQSTYMCIGLEATDKETIYKAKVGAIVAFRGSLECIYSTDSGKWAVGHLYGPDQNRQSK